MKMKVGNRLLQAREDRKLNQAEMAEFLNVSTSAYARIERNETSVDLEQLMKYAEKLEIPIQDFLPETLSINHNNNTNGQVGLVIGSVYHYGDTELAQENEHLKEKLALLEKRVADLEEMLQLYRKQQH